MAFTFSICSIVCSHELLLPANYIFSTYLLCCNNIHRVIAVNFLLKRQYGKCFRYSNYLCTEKYLFYFLAFLRGLFCVLQNQPTFIRYWNLCLRAGDFPHPLFR